MTLFVLVRRTKLAAIAVLEGRKCVEELVEVGILSGIKRNRQLRGSYVAQIASGKFSETTYDLVAHCGS